MPEFVLFQALLWDPEVGRLKPLHAGATVSAGRVPRNEKAAEVITVYVRFPQTPPESPGGAVGVSAHLISALGKF